MRKTMDISDDKLKRARKALYANSDTEAVDKALDLVLANLEIEQAMIETEGSLPGFKVG